MTVMTVEPDLPSETAVIVAVPAVTPVTSPVAETVATVEADVAQVTTRPESAAPAALSVEAVSVVVWPTLIEALLAATFTEATGVGPVVPPPVELLPPPQAARVNTTMAKSVREAECVRIRLFTSGGEESSTIGGRSRRRRLAVSWSDASYTPLLTLQHPHIAIGITETVSSIRTVQDEQWMRAALDEARAASAAGDVPVGAIVVRAGVALASARNGMVALGDATAHAELLAIRAAIAAAGDSRLAGATLYVTLEPCAMCAGAIVLGRLDRVVFGAWDDKAGMGGSVGDLLRHSRLNHRPEVEGGVLATESGDLLRAFFAERRA
jgi:tRNA(adenine34) deaminase